MNDMKVTECKCCNQSFERLSRHVKRCSGLSYEEYLLKFELDGVRPLCECGCGLEAPFTKSQGESFKRFVHGHHAKGRVKSDEEKAKIGAKNSVNMTRYLAENPDVVIERVENMKSGHTEESEVRRKLSIAESWKNNDELRQATSERSTKLWLDEREKMQAGVEKAKETFRENHEAGLHVVGTQEWRDKISASITQKYLDGGFAWSRGIHRSAKLHGKEEAYYRSSWELRHMLEMDADDNVTSYVYEPFVIPYTLDDVTHRYLPDFFVTFSDSHRELQEIGVKTLKNSFSINLAKQSAARLLCAQKGWTFKVISF